MKKKIENVKKSVLTESEFNNLIDDIFNSKVMDFKNELMKNDNSLECLQKFKNQLYKEKSKLKLNESIQFDESFNEGDDECLHLMSDVEFRLSISDIEPNFNQYRSLIDYCEDKKILDCNSFLIRYAHIPAIEYAIEKANMIYRELVRLENNEMEQYAINTREIYHGLLLCWGDFSRDFLTDEVEPALRSILSDVIPITVSIDYVEREKRLMELAENPNSFPIPRFFIRGINKRNKELCSVVAFNELNAVVDKSDHDFNLLFAIQFYVTDLMESDNFLRYHLENNFSNDIDYFKWYLETLCTKYWDFLKGKHELIVNRFSERIYNERQKKNEVTNKNKSEVNRLKQILPINFLLQYASEQAGSKHDFDQISQARFATFIIDGKAIKETRDVKNTYAYKVISGFQNKSQAKKIEDLTFIREMFLNMNINLKGVLDKIDERIEIERKIKR